jgi:hypothetical protein
MAHKCEVRKKDGKRCGANAQVLNGLCVFHDPARAADGHRARMAGGLHRSRATAVLRNSRKAIAPDTTHNVAYR